ncbi:MAG TPA: prepilin-type N-terminal cleavage/methylation domain-containing protein [Candidatus Cybelea sp.]|nr:prepilin-type N-terminal cleavage/methylation domain-containing protein [Candidatus Cybelea sp.]
MRRERGYSLIELMVALAVVVLIIGTTLKALTDASNATQAVTLMADTQENLRAGLNYMVRDITQAGEGIPQGGITIPNTGGGTPTSAVARPGPTGIGNFPNTWVALPAIASGFQLGPTTSVSGQATDMITIMYADTSLVDASGHWLNEFPIFLAPTNGGATGCAAANPNPAPAGSIVTAGSTTTVTFDPTCISIGTTIQPGDLILLENNNSVSPDPSQTESDVSSTESTGHMALVVVSAVAGNAITFSAGDAFNLNASGQPAGTISQIQSPAGSRAYPTTTATRIWMVTYYINNANTQNPQLMRQVNLKPANAVGEAIENMQLFYDIMNAGTSPVTVTANQENPTYAQLAYIRDTYILLFARSENPYNLTHQYFRNNLETVVSIRGLDFYNEFQN